MKARRYVYGITQRASLALICILVVVAGSLVIRALAGSEVEADFLLKRIAWPLWSVAFLFRLFQWVLRTVLPARSRP